MPPVHMRVGVWAKTFVPLPVELDHQVGPLFALVLGFVPLRYPRCTWVTLCTGNPQVLPETLHFWGFA